MNRRPSSEITRVVNGVTERCCKTPGCGWKPQTSEHFGFWMERGGGRWSSCCIPCRRKQDEARQSAERERNRKTQPSPTPPDLSWARLLP